MLQNMAGVLLKPAGLLQGISTTATSNRNTAAGVETRNPVGVHAWEGTQWLLRECNRDTRHAYIDAFLTCSCTVSDCGPVSRRGTGGQGLGSQQLVRRMGLMLE